MTPETMAKNQRAKIVKTARSYLGAEQGSAKHKKIINTFNKVKPDGWAMTYTAYWCAASVSAWAIETFGIVKAKQFFPLSANCATIIKKAKSMHIWKESDAYRPSPGDLILYDWDDNGKGDNTGGPDHVGLVEYVKGKGIRVIEGNKNRRVDQRVINVNGKYIRGFVVPKYEEIVKHSKRWYFIKTIREIHRYMNAHGFRYKASYTDNALTWAGAKKKKTSNCSTFVCYALQESEILKPGQYFWINGDHIEYRGTGTKSRLQKYASISHPHKPPKKAGLMKGDIVGYEDNAHTMEFHGWNKKGKPIWFSYGPNDVGDKEPKVKNGYTNKKIMTIVRIKRGSDKK